MKKFVTERLPETVCWAVLLGLLLNMLMHQAATALTLVQSLNS